MGLQNRSKYLSPLALMMGVGKKKKTPTATPSGFKRGGKVKKGGVAQVHKGEKVVGKRHRSKKR